MIRVFDKLTCLLLSAVVLIGCENKTNPAGPGRQTLIASGHPEWPPVMFRSGALIDGAGPEVVARILSDLDVPVTFSYAGTWDQVQAKARSGDVDMLVAAYKTAAREEYMVYSDAYTTDPVAIFVAAGRTFSFDN